MHKLLLGAAAGAAATLPMTFVMETLHETLPGEPARPLPPREITESMAVRTGTRQEIAEGEMQRLTLAAHVGYGAACGAIFGLFAPRSAAGSVMAGIAFGLGVWAGSYLGWLPALGVRHHAKHDPPARNGLMIAAHVAYGASTGAIVAAARAGTTRRARASTRGRALV